MIQTTLNGSNLPVLQSQLFNKEAEIVHFSTLRGVPICEDNLFSQINLCDYSGDVLSHVQECREKFANALAVDTDRMWFPRQVHGTNVVTVDSSTPNGLEADAVITKEKRLLIGVSTADCVPILLYDKKKRVVGAIHAGWRGTVAGITEIAVKEFCNVSGGMASDIIAMIGPSISPQAYEVGPEVSSIFEEKGLGECVMKGFDKPHIDLWQANKTILERSGLLSQNIDCNPLCTFYNSDKLFSARSLGVKSGRIATCIMIL